MVRITGTASVDQEPICRVLSNGNSAGFASRPKALQSARPSLGQLSSRIWMSAGVRRRSSQFQESQAHTAMMSLGAWTVTSCEQPHLEQGKDWANSARGTRKALLKPSNCWPRCLRQTEGTALRPGREGKADQGSIGSIHIVTLLTLTGEALKGGSVDDIRFSLFMQGW